MRPSKREAVSKFEKRSTAKKEGKKRCLLEFLDGQEVLVAIFMDDISDDPEDFDTASDATVDAAVDTIKDVAKLIANRYYN